MNIEVCVYNFLLQSSSSSSSEDEFNVRGPMEKRPRIENYIEEVVDNYTDAEFRENFRMNRRTFNVILNLIENQIASGFLDKGRHSISAKCQLLMAIWYLGTPDSYRSICGRFNMGKATGLRSVRRVVDTLYKLGPTFIKWPSGDYLQIVKEDFLRQGFPNVLGCIDGCHIQIPQPKEHCLSYINRKGFPSLILQGVCDHTLKFVHVYVGEVGSSHDARVLKRSEVWLKIKDMPEDQFPDNCHLLGDKAYPCLKQLMTPYRDNGNLTVAQKNFNHRLSVVRSTIERAFALLKRRFRCLKHLDILRLDWASKYILACCVLHNICIMQQDVMEGIEVVEIEDIEYQQNVDGLRERLREGQIKRDNLCNLIIH